MIFQPNMVANVFNPSSPTDPEHGHQQQQGYVTSLIGPSLCPVVTPQRSTLFVAHYSMFRNQEEPFSGPVRKLSFLHLGSQEIPTMFPYSNTCTTLDFTGHLASTNALFGIVVQLPKVNKVTISIGPSQQHYFPEVYTRVPHALSVKKLRIVMDLSYFHSFGGYGKGGQYYFTPMQYSLIHLVESILIHASDSFPNLKNLDVDLPESPQLCGAVQALIQQCPGLRKKTQAAVQHGPPVSVAAAVSNNNNVHRRPPQLPLLELDQHAYLQQQQQQIQAQAKFSPIYPQGPHSPQFPAERQFYAGPVKPTPRRPYPAVDSSAFVGMPLVAGSTGQFQNQTQIRAQNLNQQKPRREEKEDDLHQRVHRWLSTLEV